MGIKAVRKYGFFPVILWLDHRIQKKQHRSDAWGYLSGGMIKKEKGVVSLDS